MFPKTPVLGRLRPAKILDVHRIAIVATAGMYYSEHFTWARPYHASYPEDTLKSFEKIFAGYIRDPEYITLVIEDSYKADESERTDAIIQVDVETPKYKPGDSVVVGVATWKLEPGSSRMGQFHDSEGARNPETTTFDGGLDRDANLSHRTLLFEKYASTAEKFFEGCAGLYMLVVHPAYWRCGHGATMVKWGLDLAELDGVNHSVIGSTMGKSLYTSLNYKEVAVIRLQDEEIPQRVLEFSALRYNSKTNRSDV